MSEFLEPPPWVMLEELVATPGPLMLADFYVCSGGLCSPGCWYLRPGSPGEQSGLEQDSQHASSSQEGPLELSQTTPLESQHF